MKRTIISLLLIILVVCSAVEVNAQGTNKRPPADIKIDQKLNEKLPLDLIFRDEHGQEKRLGDYFGKKPILLAPVYYNCPMLCTLILNGVVESLNGLPFVVGEQFEVIAYSIDPRDKPELAAAKKRVYLDGYRYKDKGDAGWHFLTGDQEAITKLSDAIGFRYKYEVERDQFAHASGIMIVTPEGKLARYFYGIEYSPRDVKFGIMEASENKIGSPVDQLLLLCYHYDPATGKYGTFAMTMVRIGGALTLIVLGTFMVMMWRKERRHTIEEL